MKVVIIGNGIAGNQVAFTLSQQTKENEICIISAENVPEYDPCSLPYFLGGEVEKFSGKNFKTMKIITLSLF